MNSPILTHRPASGFLGPILDRLEGDARRFGKAGLMFHQSVATEAGKYFIGVPGFSFHWEQVDKKLKLPRGTVSFVLTYREPKDESRDDE